MTGSGIRRRPGARIVTDVRPAWDGWPIGLSAAIFIERRRPAR